MHIHKRSRGHYGDANSFVFRRAPALQLTCLTPNYPLFWLGDRWVSQSSRDFLKAVRVNVIAGRQSSIIPPILVRPSANQIAFENAIGLLCLGGTVRRSCKFVLWQEFLCSHARAKIEVGAGIRCLADRVNLRTCDSTIIF